MGDRKYDSMVGMVHRCLLVMVLACAPPAFEVAPAAATRAVPEFSQYPAPDRFSGDIAKIDFSSDPNARTFRTRLSRGIRKGPNFAGVYRVVSWGCGTNCSQMAIVNVETGRVCDWAWSCGSSDFELQSTLLIINPTAADDDRRYPPECDTQYYRLINEKLESIGVK